MEPSRSHAGAAGVTALGVAGFFFHAGPVYRAADTAVGAATTWAGLGSLALLLAGLLAIPARHTDARQYRTIVTVLSVFGLLLVGMGLIEPPAGAEIGWALIVIAVLALVQALVAVVVGLEDRQAVRAPIRQTHEDASPPAPEFAGYVGTPWGTEDSYQQRQASAFGQARQQVTHHDRGPAERVAQPQPAWPSFTPPASPAASGAQPAAGTAAPHGVWGHNPQPMTGQPGNAGVDRGQAR